MNYRLRPEWLPQRGVFLVWPHPYSDWQAALATIQNCYALLISQISSSEEIYLLCHDQATEQSCRRFLQNYDIHEAHLHTIIVPSNDTWIRDFGPLSLAQIDDGEAPDIVWADFRFNAWGGKYPYQLDDQATQILSQQDFAAPVRRLDWILEGGAIDINSAGVLLTTSHCMLNPNRNAMDSGEIENRLRQDLGVTDILILEAGFLQGDDTDSHVDNLARFCNEETILYCACDDKSDAHYESLANMRQQLEQWNQQRSSPFNLIPIPLPDPVYNAEGDRLAASYINFLILNHVVVVPSYHDNEKERAVMQLFSELFPTRSIVSIESRDLVAQGGGPHCASMQFS